MTAPILNPSRPGNPVLVFLLLVMLAFAGVLVHCLSAGDDKVLANRKRVQALELTDLCLFTEARYARHLSQSDLHSPFQDHPVAQEHFPSGALIGPPQHLRHAPLSR